MFGVNIISDSLQCVFVLPIVVLTLFRCFVWSVLRVKEIMSDRLFPHVFVL